MVQLHGKPYNELTSLSVSSSSSPLNWMRSNQVNVCNIFQWEKSVTQIYDFTKNLLHFIFNCWFNCGIIHALYYSLLKYAGDNHLCHLFSPKKWLLKSSRSSSSHSCHLLALHSLWTYLLPLSSPGLIMGSLCDRILSFKKVFKCLCYDMCQHLIFFYC